MLCFRRIELQQTLGGGERVEIDGVFPAAHQLFVEQLNELVFSGRNEMTVLMAVGKIRVRAEKFGAGFVRDLKARLFALKQNFTDGFAGSLAGFDGDVSAIASRE